MLLAKGPTYVRVGLASRAESGSGQGVRGKATYAALARVGVHRSGPPDICDGSMMPLGVLEASDTGRGRRSIGGGPGLGFELGPRVWLWLQLGSTVGLRVVVTCVVRVRVKVGGHDLVQWTCW